jgi:hypothetical protein
MEPCKRRRDTRTIRARPAHFRPQNVIPRSVATASYACARHQLRLPQRGSGAVAVGRGQNGGHSAVRQFLPRAQPSYEPTSQAMLLNAALIIVALLLMVLAIGAGPGQPIGQRIHASVQTRGVSGHFIMGQLGRRFHDGEVQRNRPDYRGRPDCRGFRSSGNGDVASSLSLDSLALVVCGSMLLVLDLANASSNKGQVALIGLFLVAIGGSWLWADFFEVTAWFTREASQRLDDFNPVEVVESKKSPHKPRWRARWRFGQLLAKVERE